MPKKKSKPKPVGISRWAPLVGRWEFAGSSARYIGPQEAASPFGVALAGARVTRGTIRIAAKLSDVTGAARVLFGYHAESGAYFSAGIGGFDTAYVVDEFVPGQGWRAVKAAGSSANLQIGRLYEVAVALNGQNVAIVVDDVTVAEVVLPHPLLGDQVGLFAWGPQVVEFERAVVDGGTPKAFVVMQFAEPYNSLYSEVIRPVAAAAGFEAFRADDVFRPGIILQDIIRSIVTADVVIAEVSSLNPNVFYELGYAHAIAKPTILLAQQTVDAGSRNLPFDISGFRVIFYDNTIRGKRNVETTLQKHLLAIKEGRL